MRKLLLARDAWFFGLVAGSRKLPEAAFPPALFALPGRDAAEDYDAMEQHSKTDSGRIICKFFWSGNNYARPGAARSLPTGAVRRKRGRVGAASGSSGAIFRGFRSGLSRTWSTRSWS